jgi:hypothetical protein
MGPSDLEDEERNGPSDPDQDSHSGSSFALGSAKKQHKPEAPLSLP